VLQNFLLAWIPFFFITQHTDGRISPTLHWKQFDTGRPEIL
jgi:hypothetical protein